jgi:hypothetical protein
VSWTVNFHDIPASKGSGFLKNWTPQIT